MGRSICNFGLRRNNSKSKLVKPKEGPQNSFLVFAIGAEVDKSDESVTSLASAPNSQKAVAIKFCKRQISSSLGPVSSEPPPGEQVNGSESVSSCPIPNLFMIITRSDFVGDK